jgi:hypothetical protein
MATGDITSVTIRSDGWSADVVVEGFTTGATYDFGTPGATGTSKFYLTVVSEGYNSAGTLGTVTRVVYGTKAIRKAYPNNAQLDETGGGNLTVRVALSEYVYNDDKNGGAGTSGTNPVATVAAGWCVNSGGGAQSSLAAASLACTNNSTQDYPSAFGQWDDVAGTLTRSRVKANFPLAFNARHRHGIAAVRLTATGGTSSHVQDTYVTDETSTIRSRTGLYMAAHLATIPVAGYTQGETITCRARVYPLIGDADSIQDTNGRTTAADEVLGWNDLSLICDKDNALDVIRYVSSTGNDTTGDGSEGNPWLTIAKAYLTATVNVVRILSTATFDLGTTGTRRTTSEWVVVEPVNGTITPTLRCTATRSLRCERLLLRNVTISLLNNTSYLDGEDLDNFIAFDNCVFDSAGIGAPTTGPNYKFDCSYFRNCGGDLSEVEWSINGFSSARVASRFDGCAFGAEGGTAVPIDTGYRVVACTGTNTYWQEKTSSNAAPAMNNCIFDNNRFINNNATSSQTLRTGTIASMSNWSVCGNVFEKDGATSPQVQLYADTTSQTATNWVICHNTSVGTGGGASGERWNIFYNDSGTTPYNHSLITLRGNNIKRCNIKSDTFGTPSGLRIGNWPQLYGVGWADNNFDTNDSFPWEYAGMAFTELTPTYAAGTDNYLPASGDTVLRKKVTTATRAAYSRFDQYGFWRASTYNIGALEEDTEPGAFSVTAPADTATGVSLTPTLEWTASADVVTYSFNLGTDSGFGAGTIRLSVNGLTSTSYVVGSGVGNIGIDTLPLVAGVVYYLEATATNPNGATTSDLISFTCGVGGGGGGSASRSRSRSRASNPGDYLSS